MRTIETKVYKFSELSETAKENAINNLCDINIDYEWYEYVYDDAGQVGLCITGFDLDRNRHAKGYFTESARETADKIISDHGKECETYKTALQFNQDYDELVEKYSDGINKSVVSYENEYDFDNEADELENEFLNSLLEDYAMILQKEYEYLTSKEAIIETIESNDYEFHENGKLI
jgi:hypothetical protein